MPKEKQRAVARETERILGCGVESLGRVYRQREVPMSLRSLIEYHRETGKSVPGTRFSRPDEDSSGLGIGTNILKLRMRTVW